MSERNKEDVRRKSEPNRGPWITRGDLIFIIVLLIRLAVTLNDLGTWSPINT